MNESLVVAQAAVFEREAEKAIRALRRFQILAMSMRITGEVNGRAMELRLRELEKQGLGAWLDGVLKELEAGDDLESDGAD